LIKFINTNFVKLSSDPILKKSFEKDSFFIFIKKIFPLIYLYGMKKLKHQFCKNRDQVCKGEISGSQGGKYEDNCLLGYCAVQYGRNCPMFQGDALMMGGIKHL
jgi:hypothetical protein